MENEDSVPNPSKSSVPKRRSAFTSTGGPHNLGDPDDKHLRKVEKDVIIARRLKETAKKEKCIPEVNAWMECCQKNQMGLVLFCRPENTNLMKCQEKWFFDPEFRERITKEYLHDRSEFRRTGLTIKERKNLETMGA